MPLYRHNGKYRGWRLRPREDPEYGPDCGMPVETAAERKARVLAHAERVQSDPRYRDPDEGCQRQGRKKLTNAQVIQIRQMAAEGHGPACIGPRFGVHPTTAAYVIRGKSYGWVRADGSGTMPGRRKADPPWITEEEYRHIMQMRQAGATWRAVGVRYEREERAMQRQCDKWVKILAARSGAAAGATAGERSQGCPAA